MRQQTIVKDEQGHSLVLLDMAKVYSLVSPLACGSSTAKRTKC